VRYNNYVAPFFYVFSGDGTIEGQDYNLILNQLEEKISDLKTDYERYFMGIDKIEPSSGKQQVEKVIRGLLTRAFTSTAHKFRFRQLTSRFNTYKQYWNRTLRKIDDGTYERDKFMLAHREKVKEETPAAPAEMTGGKKGEHTEDDILQSLYNGLLEAKKKCNEDTSKMYYDDFRKMIDAQSNRIKKKFKCKEIDFKIVIDNGKTKLKATLK
jgi:hypothetical protein